MITNKPKLIRITTVPVAMYKILKGQLNFLNQYFEIVGICSHERYYDDLKQQEGIRLIDVEIRREISFRKDILAIIRLFRVFRREKPAIIHSHTPKAGLLAMVAGKLAGVPIRIHTFTGIRFETAHGLFRRLLMWMDRITCFCATTVIPEGDGVKQTLIRNKITQKPLHKILNGNINGVDIDYFRPDAVSPAVCRALKNDLAIGDDDFVICFIGRIVRDKGINELVSAFDMLSRRHKCVKLLLVGPFESNLDPVSASTAEIIRTNRHVISVGLQQDVRPYLAISDLFALPSYREGFPNVVLQAGAMGVPSVVTDISGCNEIIRDGYNGMIIPPRQEKPLFDAISGLYSDRQKLLEYARNSRGIVVEKFRREIVWDAILAKYRELMQINGKIQCTLTKE